MALKSEDANLNPNRELKESKASTEACANWKKGDREAKTVATAIGGLVLAVAVILGVISLFFEGKHPIHGYMLWFLQFYILLSVLESFKFVNAEYGSVVKCSFEVLHNAQVKPVISNPYWLLPQNDFARERTFMKSPGRLREEFR